MNSIKTLLVGAAGVALLSVANAQTVIHIAGANGDRVATVTAVKNLLTGTLTYAGIAATDTASNYSTFTGGSFNGTPVTIKLAFLGATGGIKAVAGSETIRFLPDGATGNANTNPLTATNSSQYEEAVPDFTTSTNFQTTSPYIDTYNGHFYTELADIVTGVLPLNFVGSKNFPTDNITTAAAQALYLRGLIPLGFLTGSAGDGNKTIFALGRNLEAGQRYGVLAEIGLGVNAVVKQYQPTIASGVATSQTLWPVETTDSGINSQFQGNGGYNSGATLVAGLVATLGPTAYHVGNPNASIGYYVGYLTPSDAATAVAGGAVVLKYNGITYSTPAIQEGQYTPWIYTHVLYDPELSGISRDLADAIAANVKTTAITAAQGILLSTMHVKRDAEGTLVKTTYF